MQGRFTVFYNGQFWIGIFEREEFGALQTARLIFGAEPRDEELYALILTEYANLKFGPSLTIERAPCKSVNPKRRQREVKAAMQAQGVGTKAQQAVALAREAQKKDSAARRKDAKALEEQRKFALRQMKRKEKHRGH